LGSKQLPQVTLPLQLLTSPGVKTLVEFLTLPEFILPGCRVAEVFCGFAVGLDLHLVPTAPIDCQVDRKTQAVCGFARK